jgi:hypothetical protein
MIRATGWLLLGGLTGVMGLTAVSAQSADSQAPSGLPAMYCQAEQTGGFHDYPGGDETYEPALFHPQSFTLEENPVFMINLAEGEKNVDLYLTMERPLKAEEGAAPRFETTELECRQVRGTHGSRGYSCVNLPPSEMLLINADTLRFTRTAVGGWTFAGASVESDTSEPGAQGGDSIFVEYGQCVPDS